MVKISMKAIEKDLRERMDKYPHSMAPTDDEVSLDFVLTNYAALKAVCDELAEALEESDDELDGVYLGIENNIYNNHLEPINNKALAQYEALKGEDL